jgi:signal transduction histidine kinase
MRRLGLQSMRERAGLLGGTVAIDSSPQHGTTVNVRVPVSSGANDD